MTQPCCLLKRTTIITIHKQGRKSSEVQRTLQCAQQFVLKNNELYRRAFKVGQPERLVVCDYNAAEIIESVHAQLEHGKLEDF